METLVPNPYDHRSRIINYKTEGFKDRHYYPAMLKSIRTEEAVNYRGEKLINLIATFVIYNGHERIEIDYTCIDIFNFKYHAYTGDYLFEGGMNLADFFFTLVFGEDYDIFYEETIEDIVNFESYKLPGTLAFLYIMGDYTPEKDEKPIVEDIILAGADVYESDTELSGIFDEAFNNTKTKDLGDVPQDVLKLLKICFIGHLIDDSEQKRIFIDTLIKKHFPQYYHDPNATPIIYKTSDMHTENSEFEEPVTWESFEDLFDLEDDYEF